MSINSRYFRTRRYDRIRHSRKLTAFLAGVATALSATAATDNVAPVRTTNTKAEGLITLSTVTATEYVDISKSRYTFVTALTEAFASGALTFGANAANTKKVTIGGVDYTFKTALTEVKASGDLVTDNTNAADGSSCVIGSKTYLFQSTLTNIDGHIHIGADADATLLNLARAINASGGTPGTDYATANTVHPTVTSSASVTAHTITLTAKTIGTAGNAIVTTATSTAPDSHIDPEAATLTGGVNAVLNEVKIGALATNSLDNLIAAINNAAGEGSTYSTGTPADDNVVAAAGTGDTMDVIAVAFGTAGNAVTTTTDVASASWAAATLTGGVAAPTTTQQVKVGNGTTEARDNLIAAINAAAGAGTTYSSNVSAAHPSVVASAASGNVLLTGSDTANIVPGYSVKLAKSGANLAVPATLDGPGWTATAHAIPEGDGPFLLTNSGGALPTGSPGAGTELYVHVIDANTVALAAGKEALAQGNFIQTTSAGTGTHSVKRSVVAKGILGTLKRGHSALTVGAATDIDAL